MPLRCVLPPQPSEMTLEAINSTPAAGSFEYYIAQENAIDTFMGTMKENWLPVQGKQGNAGTAEK